MKLRLPSFQASSRYSTAATKALRSAGPSTGPRLGVPLPSSCQSTPASSRSLPQSLVLKGSVPSLKLSQCHYTPRAWTFQVTADSSIGPDVPKVHIPCQPLGACFGFRKYGYWHTAITDRGLSHGTVHVMNACDLSQLVAHLCLVPLTPAPRGRAQTKLVNEGTNVYSSLCP